MKVGLGIAEPSASMAICAAYETISSATRQATTPNLVSFQNSSSVLVLANHRWHDPGPLSRTQ
jgi:hypothetical protein